jgi:tetratricopeptide (TPR) repeat protein
MRLARTVGTAVEVENEILVRGYSPMIFIRVLFTRPSRLLGPCLALMTVLLLLHAQNAQASDLSNITGIDINIPAGTISFSTPRPDAIPAMIKNLPTDVLEALNPAGQELAFAVREAQAQARNGAQPIPPNIRTLLLPFFPTYILDKARWTVYDPNRVTLDSLILGSDCSDLNLPFNIDCKMGAITLDQTVVFRGAAGAQNYVSWAHELVHVSQYDSMGIDGFAFVYASPGGISLEKQAYDWQATVQSAVQRGVGAQLYWTVAPGQRTPLAGNAFSTVASRFLSDPAWKQANQVNRASADLGAPLDCDSIRGPGTDTGISFQESTNHLNQGSALEGSGNLSAAIAEYRQAVQANRTNAQAYDRLGILLVRTGQTTEGVTQLEKAVCFDASQASYRQDLASAQQATTSNPTSNFRQYQSDIFHNPTDYSSRLKLAAVLRQRGDPDGAAVQEWAAAQLAPPDGGPLYAAMRSRLNLDWAADSIQTNPVSNVQSRTRVTLRRLDSCVLSWNVLNESLNTASQTVKSFTYTVDLRRMRPQDIYLFGGNIVDLSNTDRESITSSLVVQVNYKYLGSWQSYEPLFTQMSFATFAEATAVVGSIRDIVNSCHSH